MKKSLLILMVCVPFFFYGQSVTFSNPGNVTFVSPAGITSLNVQAWGAGGAGGGSTTNFNGARAGAGGGGGAFASATLTVTSGASLPVIVGAGGTGVSGNNGNAGGFSTITGFTNTIYAAGGAGGGGNISGGSPLGGLGGTVANSRGTTRTAGGNGGAGATGASDDDGTPLSSGAGGSGANGGGAGGTPVGAFLTSNNGNAGTPPGGGGSGSRTSFFFGSNRTGGAGATGRIIISYTCPTYTLTGTIATDVNVCTGDAAEITVTGNLPVGLYSVSYEIQGAAQTPVPMIVTTAGTGKFTATGFTNVGTTTLKITSLSSGSSAVASENCVSPQNNGNIVQVTVNSSGTAPVALAGTGATCTTITANWQAVAEAVYYELDVSTASNFASFTTSDVGNVLTYTVTGSPNTTYYYRVRAHNGNCPSSNSNTISYATPLAPGAPTLTAITGNACTEFRANWNAVSNATSYKVEWSTDINFGSILGTASNVTGLNYIITGLTSGVTYYYRVASVNGCGTSIFANGGAVVTSGSVLGVPTGLASSAALCSQFTVSWTTVTGATSYVVERATDAGFSTDVVSFPGITSSPFTITGLASGILYWYRVRAVNGCGNGPFTAAQSLATSNSAPAAPGSVTAPSSSVYCTELTMNWTASAGAIDYTVERARNSNFTTDLVSIGGITGTTYTFTGLSPGFMYYYRVSARNSCGTGAPGTGPGRTTTTPTTQRPVISADGGGILTVCQTDGVNLTSTTVPSAAYTYLWSTGQTTRTIFVTAAGTYTVQFVRTGGCSSQVSVPVMVNFEDLPTAIAGGSQTICSNSGSSVTVSGATASNGTIKWTFSGGAGTLTGDTTLTPTYTPSLGGAARTVILTMRVTSNNSCRPQIATATYTVNVTAEPTVSISGSKSTCSNGAITVAAGEANAANGTILWTHDGAGTITNATTLTPTYTAAAADAGKQVTLTMAVTAPGCSIPYVVTDIYPVVVYAENTAGAPSSTPTICNDTLLTNITHATTGATGIGTPINLPPGVTAVWAADVITISGTPTSTGTFNYSIPLTGGCGTASATGTITVNPLAVTPMLGTIIQPTCVNSTGSVELTGLLAGSALQIIQDGPAPRTIPVAISGSTYEISNLAPGNYTFAIQEGANCPSLPSVRVEIKAPITNVWNSTTGWSTGADPIFSDSIEFADNYTSTGDLSACSCKVNAGKAVTIRSGHTLTIENGVVVESGANGTLTFENNASLVQINNVSNTGNIIYNRNSVPIRQADYVYWSSPVSGQTLSGVSPLTKADKYHSYDGTKWVNVSKNTVMTVGKGYIIRGPETFSNTVRGAFSASFLGIPNNGDINGEAVILNRFYLIGNPYPSALDADEFIVENEVLEGTLYFWTHNTPVVLGGAYEYASDDYASYNLTGGVRTAIMAESGDDHVDNNKSIPTGKIGAGQSFFAEVTSSGTIVFNNLMRKGGIANTQFFKPAKASQTTVLQKNRLWLNMTNNGGAFKQTMIGYIEGATNGIDKRFDGTSFDGNQYLDFYSVNNGANLVIQGRALPFADTDLVPLGYRTTISGEFTISIEQADGNLTNQAVYLEDKKTGGIYDLRSGNYKFKTEAGTFADRFVLRYTNKTLGTINVKDTEQAILVSVKDKIIKVTSTNESINGVSIFDVTGKLLFTKNKIGATELIIPNLQSGNQVLLVKTTLENDHTNTTKIIF